MAVTITTNTKYNLPNVAIEGPQTSQIGFGPETTVTFNATETFVDCTKGSAFFLTLTASITALSAINPQDGQHIWLRIKQNATGGFAVTWNSWEWASGSAPTITVTANATDIVEGVWNDTLGKWVGHLVAANIS